MYDCPGRKERLERLLDLARSYRGWTRKELAKALHRDPTKLVPASGTPKIDLVIALAGVLDWSVQAVVDYLWSGIDAPDALDPRDFAALDAQALQAHRDGRYQSMIDLARAAWEAATTPDQRATACNREAGGHDGLGQYANALAALRRGLRLPDIEPRKRRMLQANLANACYTLWYLVEARTIARDLIKYFDEHPPDQRADRAIAAFAQYVHGQTLRRAIDTQPGRLERAIEDLRRAQSGYLSLAEDFDDPTYCGVAQTCEGGLLELETARGDRDPIETIAIFEARLDGLIDVSACATGDLLESYGWWCIFGCNVALRHLDDEKQLQSTMAVLTNKADEVANHLDHWAMRERVFTLEYARRQRFQAWTGVDAEWTLDRDDLRVLTGAMGRFPEFRVTGWRILDRARLVG